jgi:RNA recognition motif-containing protein
VGGLTRTVNKEHLEEMFGTFGKIKSAEVTFIPRTTVSKGFGYVEFFTKEDALKAIDYMHGYVRNILGLE